MIWEFCKYCIINGKCENQDRGHKCETGYKILFEEKEKLKELLKKCRYELEGEFGIGAENLVEEIEEIGND